MSEQLNNGKGFLKDKLGDYQVNPPESVWDSIASQLGGRSRRSIIIITLSAAAALALAVTLGINFFGPEPADKEGIAATLDTPIQTPDPETATQIPDIKIEEIEALQNSTTESETVRRKETLEEKVIRALDDIQLADNQMEVPASPGTEMVIAEVSEEILLVQQDFSDLGDKTLVENLETMENPVVAENLEFEENLDATGNLDVTENVNVPENLDATEEQESTSDPLDDFLENQTKNPRWIVGAALSPLYSFRDAEASAMAGGAEFESGIVAYAGGVHVSYRTASRLAIESGIYYNKMGISIGAPGIQLSNESFDFSPLAQQSGRTEVTSVTNSVGNIVAKSGDVYVNNYLLNASSEINDFSEYNTFDVINANEGIRQHLDYLELPFNLRYTLVDRAIELQLVGGMSTNFLINNYVTMETSGGATDIGYLTNIRSVNYSGNAGLGMVYHIREKFSLRLEPRFRYFLNSINDATLPSTRPYTLGIYTGLNYTF